MGSSVSVTRRSTKSSRVALIDAAGAKYFAIGMVEDDGSWVTVRSMGGKPLSLKDIPIQPLGSGSRSRPSDSTNSPPKWRAYAHEYKAVRAVPR